MTSPLALGNPFALGATGVQTTARTDRISMGASFRPASAALAATGGVLYGPAGTMGELTLLSDALLRVNPFTAVVQGTHNSQQGQYIVPNAAQRDLTVPAKDASQQRRALLVVRVADSLEAGVASSATTDGAFLDLLPGALAASNPALPATPANAVALGELLVPSTASGQPVTLTPYNPRTTARGGILPVVDDALTYPGHGAAPGLFVSEYRDHPLYGLQRWNGIKWARPGGDWQTIAVRTDLGWAGTVHGLVDAGMVTLRLESTRSASWATTIRLCDLPAWALPAMPSGKTTLLFSGYHNSSVPAAYNVVNNGATGWIDVLTTRPAADGIYGTAVYPQA